MNWIQEILNATKDSEAPERYFYWAGLTAISAVVRHNIYLERFYYKLYPNIYVVLVSEKSGLRKGSPISTARKLVSRVGNTKIIAGRASIQGVVKELSLQYTSKNGSVLSDASCFIAAPELRSFLVDDTQALPIMTDLFDTHAHVDQGWKSTLKGLPTEELNNIYVTMIGGANEAMLHDLISQRDMEGGFVARTFMVYESRLKSPNSLMYAPKILPDYDKLSEWLKEVANLRGPFMMTDDSRYFYDNWYIKILIPTETSDRTGTLQRLGDQVLKVSMLLALAKRQDLFIHKEDIEESIEKCQECIIGAKRVSLGKGKNILAPQTKIVLMELVKAGETGIARQKLLKKHWGEFDSGSLDQIVNTLNESRALKSSKVAGIGIVYHITKEAYEQYTKFAEEES